MENKFDKKLFAKRLKEIRKSKGLTQDQICDLTGIEVSNYSKMETGKIAPSMLTLQKLVLLAGFVPNELFEYSHLDSEENLDKKILEILKNLSLSEKKAFYKILRALEDLKD